MNKFATDQKRSRGRSGARPTETPLSIRGYYYTGDVRHVADPNHKCQWTNGPPGRPHSIVRRPPVDCAVGPSRLSGRGPQTAPQIPLNRSWPTSLCNMSASSHLNPDPSLLIVGASHHISINLSRSNHSVPSLSLYLTSYSLANLIVFARHTLHLCMSLCVWVLIIVCWVSFGLCSLCCLSMSTDVSDAWGLFTRGWNRRRE